MTKRRAVVGGSALIAYVVAYCSACRLVPADDFACTLISDLGFVALQAIVLVLCILAWHLSKNTGNRWVWFGTGLWLLLNLFADSVWAYYEVRARVKVPFPGLADVGYLGSYIVGFLLVITATRKAVGRLRALEASLDATMLTIGVAGLLWPFILGPMLRDVEGGSGFWVNLAYPVGDLLILLAIVFFFLASSHRGSRRPRGYLLVISLAILCQSVADSAYFIVVQRGGVYGPGSWMDTVWLLAFAIAGIAALMGIHAAGRPSVATVEEPLPATAPPPRRGETPGRWRVLIPYVVLAVLIVVFMLEFRSSGWQWGSRTWGPFVMGFIAAMLLLVRQYTVLTQNRRLSAGLTQTSAELEAKVDDLESLNRRLEILNEQSTRINTLRDLREVAGAGLELACSFAGCPRGWLTLRDDDGRESVVATRGQVDRYYPGTPSLNAVSVARDVLKAVPLEIRGETLGTMWLVRPAEGRPEADLLPVIATHVATSIDNAKRYEEAVHLAERDALTGLYNHRGIHRRLAGEALRAQQSGAELSLVMIDLDDFKALNDTYGHPTGDAVLRHVSDAVRSVLRHADLAGRVGGDELLIVLPNTGSEGALQLCERLQTAQLSKPYTVSNGRPLPISLSLGVATCPEDARSLGQLIEIADANLYASKQRGGGTVTGAPANRPDSPPVDAAGILGIAGRLLNVVGARDHYTRRHSEHVALYALSLGEAVGLSDESLSTLHVAAMLHDVGKIGVAGDLLRKPGPLDEGEEDMVRRHAELSAAVIRDLPRLAQVAEAVQAHHENHDGSGYPGEISGDDIPVLARILAIADAYSAMTFDRPYRKSLTPGQAREELLRSAGTRFDPDLVAKFVQILDAQAAQTAESEAAAG
ncbi:MAG: diguanylate cyclase [Thermoleophilia bacterium]|nr:diguanylate cyclase [Thermoleophilia bacterium]